MTECVLRTEQECSTAGMKMLDREMEQASASITENVPMTECLPRMEQEFSTAKIKTAATEKETAANFKE